MRSRGGSRRRKDWQSNSNYELVPGTITPGTLLLASYWIAFPADTFGEDDGINNQIEQEEDNTIVRLLTSVSVSFEPVVQMSNGVVFGGAGIIRWESNTQDRPNPLTIPNPIIDSDADWLWQWNQGSDMTSVPANTPRVLTNFVSSQNFSESRAKRKLTSKQGLLFVAAVDNSFGTQSIGGFAWANWTRFLVLLA